MDITKLDLNWGGAGFPSYDGRMEDEGGPMDSGARADAALAAFSGNDDPDPVTDPNEDPNADPTSDPAADPNAADPNADPTAGQITDEQLQADPRFQELSTLRDSVANLASEFGIPLDDKGNPDLNETKLQLSDAAVLYQIMQGKGTPSALLDVMAQNANWNDQQKQAIAQDLIGWLTKAGYLKDGQAAAGDKKGPQGEGFKDPIQARLDKIEQERQTERQTQEQQRIATHQKEVFDTKFMPKINDLCKQKGIPPEDIPGYANQVAALINGNKAILARIEKGNHVDVQKFFTQIYNAEVARLQRWNKTQIAANQKKGNQPRIPAGGAPPAPEGSAKVNVKSREDRLAAAAELL